MGLFGNYDAAEVPENPFYVAPDTYFCTLAEVKVVEKKNGDGQGLAFQWVIEDEDSDYYKSNIQDWKNIYPDIAEEDITPNIRKDFSRLKQRLLEIGVPESEMDGLLDRLEDLVGTEAYVEVIETTDKDDPTKKYTNVRKVRIDE